MDIKIFIKSFIVFPNKGKKNFDSIWLLERIIHQ
jgi:hypothetical protein